MNTLKAFCIPLCLATASCSGGLLFSCNTKTLESVPSPSGKHVAVVSSTDCGATTSATLEVSIAESGASVPDEGNAMIVDHAPPYSELMRPVWTSDDTVQLTIPDGAKVFENKEAVGGVSVLYKGLRN